MSQFHFPSVYLYNVLFYLEYKSYTKYKIQTQINSSSVNHIYFYKPHLLEGIATFNISTMCLKVNFQS